MLEAARRYAAKKLWEAVDLEHPTLRELFWHTVARALYGKRPDYHA